MGAPQSCFGILNWISFPGTNLGLVDRPFDETAEVQYNTPMSPRWFVCAGLVGVIGLGGCWESPFQRRLLLPPPTKAEPEIRLALPQARLVLPGSDGQPLWDVRTGLAAAERVEEEETLFLREVTCRYLGQTPTEVTAPELTWRRSENALVFRGPVKVVQGETTFTAQGVKWEWAADQFQAWGGVTFRRDRLTATGDKLTADTALTEAEVENVEVRERTAEGEELWHVAAQTARFTAQQIVRLREARGVLRPEAVETHLSAPQVEWKVAEQVLTLSGGVRAEREDTVLTAPQVTWEAATDRLTAPGPVTLERGGLTVTGRNLAADTALRTAQLTAVQLTSLTEEHTWRVKSDRVLWTAPGRLVCTPVAAEFRNSGDLIRILAPRAVWQPEAQTLTLTGGVRAETRAQGLTLQAQQAVWHHRTRRLAVMGEVRLYRREGGELRGQRLTYETRTQEWVLE